MKLYKVFDSEGKLLGHVNAADEKAGLEQAKKRDKRAAKCGDFTGGALPVVGVKKGTPAKEEKEPEDKVE